MDKPGDLSDRESEVWVEVIVVLDVTDVLVSPACDIFSFCSDWDLVEPQSLSLSKKGAHSCTVTQEEMRV